MGHCADPDGKLAAAVAKRLGAPLSSAPVQRALGDVGAAAAMLGAVQALAEVGDGTAGATTLGIIGYGGGRATAVAIDVVRAVPGAHDIAGRAAGRGASYVEALRARGQLEPMGEPIAMGVPPGGAAFVRGNGEMLGLAGARCRRLRHDLHAPVDPPQLHRLRWQRARRGGAWPAGARCRPSSSTRPCRRRSRRRCRSSSWTSTTGHGIMVQGSPADAVSMGVGDVVTLTLRRYALERGVPVYGYKAMPGAAPGPDDGRAGRGGTTGEGRP